MATLNITVTKPKNRNSNKIMVEIDADKFERLAASLGLFNPEFLKSVEKSEEDYRSGRVRKIKSLKDLRTR